MVTDQSHDGIRRKVAETLHEFQTAVAQYARATDRSPSFLLGEGVPEVVLPPDKLSSCRLLNDRREIVRLMPKTGNVVEVGTQSGYFAKFILSECPEISLFTIDIDYSRFAYEVLYSFIETGRLTTIEGCSWDELAKFPEGFFSWIYIDASHALDHIRRDLDIAKTRVGVNGFVVCNDYTIWSPFEAVPYGVLPAVNEFLTRENFELTYFALHPFGYHDVALRRLI